MLSEKAKSRVAQSDQVQPETTYWYRVFAQNAGGLSLLASNVVSATTVTAPNNPPTANAGGTYSGTVNQSITFDGSGSFDPDGDPLTYAWNFGDGNMGSGQQTAHTYTSTDTFTVMLTVSDGNGGIDTATTTATVGDPSTITLSASGYKVQGRQKADLTWSGAVGGNVDVYRDDNLTATTANDGAYTDNINNRGGGSYTYRVCEAGTTTCSNDATVSF